ncbi:hypothetical protein DCAR_0311428 [Daucus carota subsp. sativus]|uniref:Uncharacterized protein n=1 Tax=Daucus carota subsp. sativus TaxID=79200 RepID=A0AAF0WPP4_DAUCS|nr:hypothetical protein DCAR_0311428 [Daucus carota subsp. sativus]
MHKLLNIYQYIERVFKTTYTSL